MSLCGQHRAPCGISIAASPCSDTENQPPKTPPLPLLLAGSASSVSRAGLGDVSGATGAVWTVIP